MDTEKNESKLELQTFARIPMQLATLSVLRFHDQRLFVHVHIPDADPEKQPQEIQRIRDSVAAFLAEYGYLPDPQETSSMVTCSWDWKEWFKSLDPRVKQEGAVLYQDMKEALRRAAIDKTGAEAFEKRATAASALVASLVPYDRVFVRLGDVIIVKAMIDGRPRLVVETLSPLIARALEENPSLTSDPDGLLKYLDSVTQGVRHEHTGDVQIEGTGSVKAGPS